MLGDSAFGAIRGGGVYVPVRGWGDQPSERGIVVRPVFVFQVLGRTDWLEQIGKMAASGEMALGVAGEFTPAEAAEAQRSLAAGGLRGRPVILFR